MRQRWLLWFLLGCGSSGGDHPEDARSIDARAIDGAPADAAPVTPARDVTSAGGRITGGAYTMDVQLGGSFSQAPAKAAGTTFEANTAVKP